MSRLFYRAIVRAMTDDQLIPLSRWNAVDGEPMNFEADELQRRWSKQ